MLTLLIGGLLVFGAVILGGSVVASTVLLICMYLGER